MKQTYDAAFRSRLAGREGELKELYLSLYHDAGMYDRLVEDMARHDVCSWMLMPINNPPVYIYSSTKYLLPKRW